VRSMARSEFVFAWKVIRLETGTPLFDLSQWASCRAEYVCNFLWIALEPRLLRKKNLTTNLCSDFSTWRSDAGLRSRRSYSALATKRKVDC
jgi:hypothetical protein